MVIFIQQVFSLLRTHGVDKFQEQCPANSNGCIRVNKVNQYRANNIEMRLPVTFKQTNLDALIWDWVSNNYDNRTLVTADNTAEMLKDNSTFIPKEKYYYFYHTTWYGLVIDTKITVHDCVQVFKAQTVTMQSQTRVGFKDYGTNYDVSSSFYNFLNDQVQKEGLKSFISCT